MLQRNSMPDSEEKANTTVVTIQDKQREAIRGVYLFTYVPHEPLGTKDISFPLRVSVRDGETMLHALQLLSQQFEEVNQLVRVGVTEEKMLQDPDYTPDGCLPWIPFVRLLAGSENMYTIEWAGDDIGITKMPSGIEVNDHAVKYLFSYEHFFSKSFIDAVGEGVFEDEPIYSSSYLHEYSDLGENDICEILEPYKSIFVPENLLPDILQKLKAWCTKMEAVTGENFFLWNDGPAAENFLSEVIRLNVEMNEK